MQQQRRRAPATYHTHGVACAYQSCAFADAFLPAADDRSDDAGIGGSFAAGMDSYVFDLDRGLLADFGRGGGTTATTDSCSMACGVPCVLCDAMRMFASTKPGGVDGDADEAGLVDVEYDCSGVSGVSGLVGGLG